MDVKYIKDLFYEAIVGKHTTFILKNGHYWKGKVEAWLDDGTILFDGIRLYNAKGEAVHELTDSWTLLNLDEVSFITGLYSIPKGMICASDEAKTDKDPRCA